MSTPAVMVAIVAAFGLGGPLFSAAQSKVDIDQQLTAVLAQQNFTGTLEADSLKRLGRPVDTKIAEVGQHLFFDRILSLANDNSCSGCHAPQFGFADSQSIAIGVESNCVVGPGRIGPHNQRRSPTVANAVLYPTMMWNGRFSSTSGDSLDNKDGFLFPAPEGNLKFGPYDGAVKMLMAAQGHMPSTELPEMAGFRGADGLFLAMSRFGGELGLVSGNTIQRAENTTRAAAKSNNLSVRSRMKIAAVPAPVPGPCGTVPDVLPSPEPPIESPNEPIRREVIRRLQNDPGYAKAFAGAFPAVKAGHPINFAMVGEALAEFQMQLVFADAPIDRYARGDKTALSASEKRGALVFFGKGKCSACHTVTGAGDELFSDFKMHNIGVPPLYPEWKTEGNVEFKGPNRDLDLGLAEFTDLENRDDWYRFRTSPLRNIGLAPTFMHNGAYTRLEDAVEHHLDPRKALMAYDPASAGVKRLTKVGNRNAIAPSISPLLARPIILASQEKADLIAFVRNALTDARARPVEACKRIPAKLFSGNPLLKFEGC